MLHLQELAIHDESVLYLAEQPLGYFFALLVDCGLESRLFFNSSQSTGLVLKVVLEVLVPALDGSLVPRPELLLGSLLVRFPEQFLPLVHFLLLLPGFLADPLIDSLPPPLIVLVEGALVLDRPASLRLPSLLLLFPLYLLQVFAECFLLVLLLVEFLPVPPLVVLQVRGQAGRGEGQGGWVQDELHGYVRFVIFNRSTIYTRIDYHVYHDYHNIIDP